MKSEILKQTIAQMRTQKMLTLLGIAGTALSIFLIMVVVMIHEVKVLPFEPESGRGRMLHVKYGLLEQGDASTSSGNLSHASLKSLVDNLPTAEAACIHQRGCSSGIVEIPAGGKAKLDFRAVDDRFWRVFDFRFLHGRPFNKAEFESGLPVAVVSRSTARRLFGTEHATGREFRNGKRSYRVCGVVEDVSTLADCAYSEVWLPITASRINETWCDGVMGDYSATILARDSRDFDAIRREYSENVRRLNSSIEATGWKYNPLGAPYDQETYAACEWSNVPPDVEGGHRSRMIVYLILLIVPAINLSGMTESRLRRRVVETGVRRAFGCTRSAVFRNLIAESLVITLIAGLIGWTASVLFAMGFSADIFSDGWGDVSTNMPRADLGMLVQWKVFATSLVFCFVLNLLSNSLPSWRASRQNVVSALNGHM